MKCVKNFAEETNKSKSLYVSLDMVYMKCVQNFGEKTNKSRRLCVSCILDIWNVYRILAEKLLGMQLHGPEREKGRY
jgi:hypothetical protein